MEVVPFFTEAKKILTKLKIMYFLSFLFKSSPNDRIKLRGAKYIEAVNMFSLDRDASLPRN